MASPHKGTSSGPFSQGQHFSINRTSRYAEWYATAQGVFAHSRKEELLRSLISGWFRRSHSMLVLNAGDGFFLEHLWELGFDVTAQDSSPNLLSLARQRLGKRADFVLAAPDHLPFDDRYFDYAVAIDAFEFWDRPEAVLQEIARVACSGLILIFPNKASFFALECCFAKKNSPYKQLSRLFQNPYTIYRLCKKAYGPHKIAWASSLLAPSLSWQPHSWLQSINTVDIKIPIGAFTGIRVDFGPERSGRPLAIPSRDIVASTK